MKHFFRFGIQITLILFLLQISPASYGFGSKPETGTVTVKQSAVWVQRDNKKLSVGSFGLALEKGDIVKTDESGKARVTFADGSKIFIAPNSELEINEEVLPEEKSAIFKLLTLFSGKVRSQIQKKRKQHMRIKTATAVIGVKGTDFVTEYKNGITTVGTMEGLVNLESLKTKASVDIPPGKMASVSPVGELLPLSEFAGELMEGVEFAGKKMEEEDIAGEKISF